MTLTARSPVPAPRLTAGPHLTIAVSTPVAKCDGCPIVQLCAEMALKEKPYGVIRAGISLGSTALRKWQRQALQLIADGYEARSVVESLNPALRITDPPTPASAPKGTREIGWGSSTPAWGGRRSTRLGCSLSIPWRSLSSMRKAWSDERRSRHTSQQRRRRQPRQPQTSSYIVQLRARKHVDRAMASAISDSFARELHCRGIGGATSLNFFKIGSSGSPCASRFFLPRSSWPGVSPPPPPRT